MTFWCNRILIPLKLVVLLAPKLRSNLTITKMRLPTRTQIGFNRMGMEEVLTSINLNLSSRKARCWTVSRSLSASREPTLLAGVQSNRSLTILRGT